MPSEGVAVLFFVTIVGGFVLLYPLVRALAERRANAGAQRTGSPMPYPNIWDELDPTKVPRDASEEDLQRSYAEFRRLCPQDRKNATFSRE